MMMVLMTRNTFCGICICSMLLHPIHLECQRGLAMRKVSVCPSVCLSVKRVHCDKTEERSVQIFIPYERSLRLDFWEEEWLVGGGRPLLPEILGQPASVGAKSPKVQLTLISKSTTRFSMSLRGSSYVAPKPPPPEGGLKNAKRPFSV